MNLKVSTSSKILRTIVVFTFIMSYSESCESYVDQFINYLKEYMDQVLMIKRISLITSIHNKSSISLFFIREMIDSFSTLMIDPIDYTSSNSHSLIRLRELMKTSSETSVEIAVIDVHDESSVIEELLQMVDFFMSAFNKLYRGKFLIILIYNQNISLRSFYDSVWLQGYLEITVIQLMKTKSFENPVISAICDQYNGLVHIFNPFYDVYERKLITDKFEIFPNKLRDLNGYTLSTGLYEDSPLIMIEKNYTGPNIWDSVHGLSIDLVKTLADTMHFTPQILVIESEDEISNSFNVTYMKVVEAIENNLIDFSINVFVKADQPTPEKLDSHKFKTYGMTIPTSYHLIVKQYSTRISHFPLDLFNTFCFVLILVLILSGLGQILHLNIEITQPYNILMALIGSSITYRNQLRMSEKIFLLSKIALSIILLFFITDQIMGLNIYRHTFLQIKTIKSVLDSGIVPSVSKSTKVYLSNRTNDPIAAQLLKRSLTLETANQLSDCPVDMIMRSNEKSRYGCEVRKPVGEYITRSFSDRKSGWKVSFVEEPIYAGVTSSLVTTNSPYDRHFTHVIERFYEVGLITHWWETSLTKFNLLYKNRLNERLFTQNKKRTYKPNNRDHSVSPKKLLGFLLIAHSISGMIFICELLWKRQLKL